MLWREEKSAPLRWTHRSRDSWLDTWEKLRKDEWKPAHGEPTPTTALFLLLLIVRWFRRSPWYTPFLSMISRRIRLMIQRREERAISSMQQRKVETLGLTPTSSRGRMT